MAFRTVAPLGPNLSTHFIVSQVITFGSCSDLTSATPDKCSNNYQHVGGTTMVDCYRVRQYQTRYHKYARVGVKVA